MKRGRKAGGSCFRCGGPHFVSECTNRGYGSQDYKKGADSTWGQKNFSRMDQGQKNPGRRREDGAGGNFSLFRRGPNALLSKNGSRSSAADVKALESERSSGASDGQLTADLHKMSPGQKAVIAAIEARDSVFFTGCAGTGKSFLLNHIIRSLPKDGTFVTASTGIAAVAIGGTTIHSFAGIGLGDLPTAELVSRVKSSRDARKRWQTCKTLILDEVSMIDGDLFDKLEAVARGVRDSHEPFGGVQLVMTGDFLQLPPVNKRGHAKFCFEALTWPRCVPQVLELTRVFRQSDMDFIDILNKIRFGDCDSECTALLRTCINRRLPSDGIEPTKLHALKASVASENQQRLNQLNTDPVTFCAQDVGEQRYVTILAKNCAVPSQLVLKQGAQVMLVKNLHPEKGLVNGSRGFVKEMVQDDRAQDEQADQRVSPSSLWPVVHFTNGEELVMYPEKYQIEIQNKVVAERKQVPLILAWSLTIHKCQGMTLDRVQLSLSRIFEHGQAYVALSRCRSLEGLALLDFDPSVVRASPKAKEFYSNLKASRPAGGHDDRGNMPASSGFASAKAGNSGASQARGNSHQAAGSTGRASNGKNASRGGYEDYELAQAEFAAQEHTQADDEEAMQDMYGDMEYDAPPALSPVAPVPRRAPTVVSAIPSAPSTALQRPTGPFVNNSPLCQAHLLPCSLVQGSATGMAYRCAEGCAFKVIPV